MKQQTKTKVLKLEKQRKQLEKEIENVKRHIAWKCPGCKRGTQIRFLNLIVPKYYVPPSGCNDGDYWTEGSNPEYNIICPKCSQRIRVYHSNFDVPLKELWILTHSLRSSFKSETAEYRG